MFICKTCNKEKPIYISKITGRPALSCLDCNVKLTQRNSKIKKSSVKTQYRNCTINDGSKFYQTNNLSEDDIKYLRTNGYQFIFK